MLLALLGVQQCLLQWQRVPQWSWSCWIMVSLHKKNKTSNLQFCSHCISILKMRMWKSGILLLTTYALDRQNTDGLPDHSSMCQTCLRNTPMERLLMQNADIPTHQQIFYFQSRTAFYLPGSKANSMPAKHELHLCAERLVSQDPWDQRKDFPFPSTPVLGVVRRYVTGIESAPCNSHRKITVKYRNNSF